MNTQSEGSFAHDTPPLKETIGDTFNDQLIQSLTSRLAAQFHYSTIEQDGTQPLTYVFEDSRYGIVTISDYYNRAHKDDRVRSYLQKTLLNNQHLLLDDVTPIINFSIGDIQYAVFKPRDVDRTNGIGEILTLKLPDNLDPDKTVVTKSMQVVDHPEEDPVLQWLTHLP